MTYFMWHHKRRQTQSLKMFLGTKPQKQIYQLIHMIVMKKCVCIQRAEVIIISSSNHEMGQKNRLFSLKLHALHKLYRLNPPFFLFLSKNFPTAARLRLLCRSVHPLFAVLRNMVWIQRAGPLNEGMAAACPLAGAQGPQLPGFERRVAIAPGWTESNQIGINK